MSVACAPARRLDMSDLNQVIDYARSLGRGMVVFKHPTYLTYSVCLKSQTHKYAQEWVVYEVR